VPPEGFLHELRAWCDEVGAILIFDEIYTGFWRTGRMFACDCEGIVPDLICLGKALSGGFPISVCVGRAKVMDAWPESGGEALHTSTFLGNPMGCAMALEAIRRYREPELEEMVQHAVDQLEHGLNRLVSLEVVKEVRGMGLMMGVQMDSGERVLDLVKAMLRAGVIALPDGPKGDVLALTPPLGISGDEIEFSMNLLKSLME
jgi:acetylornithine/succinyldiaminopimelate/putrescine aminotransferase